MMFLGDYFEPPYYAECGECGSTLGEEGECLVCIEADSRLEWEGEA